MELASHVAAALDDVCTASRISVDAVSLAALLREVCGLLVKKRLGPHAEVERYRDNKVRTTIHQDKRGSLWRSNV